MRDFEDCRAHMSQLAQSDLAIRSDRNEAATRLHLIDEMFFGCLAWEKADCEPEDRLNGEYADYVFSNVGRVLVVEAKREGHFFTLPAGVSKRVCKIATLLEASPDCAAAIRQVTPYAQERGISVALVTNGHEFMGFLAAREDGVPPMNGQAVVFRSLAEIDANFPEFWDYFSKPGVAARGLRRCLTAKRSVSVPLKLSQTIPAYPGVKRRNPLQSDLQIVADLVLEDLAKSKDLNETFLRECYCDSGALSQYALVSKRILETRYDAMFGDLREGPSVVPARAKEGISKEMIAESLSKRPILLIGDVGVGKSSFINYFTRIYTPEIQRHSIILYIDLGNRATLSSDLREFVMNELERQLREKYELNIHDTTFVRAVYRSELKLYEKSIFAQEAKIGSPEFEQRAAGYLVTLVERRDEHLSRSLSELSKVRQRQVIIFIDNADQRSANTQQKAFLIAQELSQTWPAAVFVALRPETFYRSVRSGSLSGYHPKAFTIAPPRVDRVIEKRLDFGIRLASGELPFEGISSSINISFH